MAIIKLKYSSDVSGGAAKAPSTLESGEVAINNATNYESLFLKNSGNQIIKLPINYLKGITSDVQTQIDGKQPLGNYSTTSHTHTNLAYMHGNDKNYFNVSNLNVYDSGLYFHKYSNSAGGYDGAHIILDNEGVGDSSKLLFYVGDDTLDSFKFKVGTYNPVNINYNSVKINGNVDVIGNINASDWIYGKNSILSGFLEATESITSKADVKAGSKCRILTNADTAGWLQLGGGSYKHGAISALYGERIDDLEVMANTTKFTGDVIAYSTTTTLDNNKMFTTLEHNPEEITESPTEIDILIDKCNRLENQVEYLVQEIINLKLNLK